jgi:hypothetical protein
VLFLGNEVNSATLSGTGTIVFGGAPISSAASANAVFAYGLPYTTLTIASGITIQGGDGIVDDYNANTNDSTVVMNGTFSFASGAALGLGGVATTSMGTFHCTGASVDIVGQITGPLTLSGGAMGNWFIDGGSLRVSSIASSNGATLGLTPGGGTIYGGGLRIAAGCVIDGTQSFGVGTVNFVDVDGSVELDGTINLGAANGSTSGQVLFTSYSANLYGNGKVVFGGAPISQSNPNAIYAKGSGSSSPVTVTIGLTIQGGDGIVAGYYQTATDADQIVNNSGVYSFASGGVLGLGGVATASLGLFQCTGATVDLIGPLANAGATLTLSGGTMGNWFLDGGTINGGTIVTSNATLGLTPGGGTLAGVTIAAGSVVDGTQPTGATAANLLNVTGGITNNGTLNLGASNGKPPAQATLTASNLSGVGSTVVGSGSSLTVQGGLIQSSLMIGGTTGSPGLVTIAASDANGNPLDMAQGGPLDASASGAVAAALSSSGLRAMSRAAAVSASSNAAGPFVPRSAHRVAARMPTLGFAPSVAMLNGPIERPPNSLSDLEGTSSSVVAPNARESALRSEFAAEEFSSFSVNLALPVTSLTAETFEAAIDAELSAPEFGTPLEHELLALLAQAKHGN